MEGTLVPGMAYEIKDAAKDVDELYACMVRLNRVQREMEERGGLNPNLQTPLDHIVSAVVSVRRAAIALSAHYKLPE